MTKEELKSARKAAGASASAYAALLGISRRTLAYMETGERPITDEVATRARQPIGASSEKAAAAPIVAKARERVAAKSLPAAQGEPLAPYQGAPPHNVKHVRRPTDEERRAHHYLHGPNVWIQEKPGEGGAVVVVVWYGSTSGLGDWSHYWPDSKRPAPDFTDAGRKPTAPPPPPKGGQRRAA